MTDLTRYPFPPDLAAELPAGVELRPPLGPEGWPGIRYPAGDQLQLAVFLGHRERRIHVAATHRPWTADQADDIARILTSCSAWLRQLPTDDTDTS